MTSGQVFRWDDQGGGKWLGADGSAWYRVDTSDPSRLQVESNEDDLAFRRLFRLDEDASAYRDEILRQGPELAPYVQQFSGLRVMRPSSVVETTVSFLCTPNNNLTRILKMVRWLAEQGKEPSCAPVRCFPSLEKIAGLSEHSLRMAGFGYRAETVPAVCRQIIERGGEDWLLSLRSAGYEQSFSQLVGLKGIGPKLADCICLFGLHCTEAVPIDTHIWQAAKRLYFPDWEGKALTGQKYKLVGSHFRGRFGPLAGWAQQFLFYDNLTRVRTGRPR